MRALGALLACGMSSALAQRPTIDVWYGENQTFGDPGVAQRWVNVLGNVSAPDGISSLTYSLNGGPSIPLSVGPDTRRLYYPGDFNIEIDFDDLHPGYNGLAITATDSTQETSVANVNLNYVDNQVWPLPVNIDWSNVTAVQDVAQMVDGEWTIENNVLRAPPMAYDRVIAFGDVAWTNYEVTASITQLDLDSNGFLWPSVSPGFGITLRWPGHSDNPVACSQPHCGWLPSGAGVWYDTGHDGPLSLSGDNGLHMTEQRTLAYGVPYIFKIRVQDMPGEGTLYAVKVWEEGANEPTEWDMIGLEGLNDEPSGSCILIAHHVDLVLGQVDIVPLRSDPAPIISSIELVSNASSVEISWETNEATKGYVEYGPTDGYEDGSVASADNGSAHTVSLTGLTTGATYHYRITAVDMDSNATTTTDATFEAQGDTTTPVIRAVNVKATPTVATVTWQTDELADSRIEYGLTPDYSMVSSNGALGTDHTLVLTDLDPETEYFFRVDSADEEGNSAVGDPDSFTTPAAASPVLTSDHFNQQRLDTETWYWVDPLSDGASYSMTGQQFQLNLPATGVEHQLWTDGILAPRLLQPSPDVDFQVEAKFDSPVTEDTVIQGIVVQESSDHLLRMEFHYLAGSTRIFIASVMGPKALVRRHLPIALTAPMYLRVGRSGSSWTVEYSLDGDNYILVHSFIDPLTVTAVGLHAGNDGDSPHTMLVDYFRDTSDANFVADCNLNGTADGADISAGTSADCNITGMPDECELSGNDCDNDGVPDECELDCNTNGTPDDCEAIIDCNTNGIPDVCELAENDCDTNGLLDTCEVFVDCNTNGVPDECDLANNDCDSNGVPDECDADCNKNGTPDACEQLADCNTNAIPDECELTNNDCDSNGAPDECDADCNANGMPDACEVFADCNSNRIPDDCEVAGNDCDTNGVPDECEFDCDGNGTPDACEQLADCDMNGYADICEIAAGSAIDSNLDSVLDICQVLNLTRGSGHPSIADAIADAADDDVLLAPSSFFQLEPDIDFNGLSLRLMSDGPIVQPSGGNLSPANDAQFAAANGADIVLNGATSIGLLDDVAFDAGQFVLNETGSIHIGASASAEITANDAVRLDGDVDILPQATLASSLRTVIGGKTDLLGGTIASPNVKIRGGSSKLTAFGNVAGSLENTDGAQVLVLADLQILGDFNNQSTTTLQNGTLTVLGSLINGGTIIGDQTKAITSNGITRSTSSGMFVRGDWVASPSAALHMPAADWSLRIGGDFDCAINDPLAFDLSQARMEMAGESPGEQTFELMGQDIGADVNGLVPGMPGHYPIGTLRIGPTPTTVRLVDDHGNVEAQGPPETVYVDHLVVESGAVLLTNGALLYYRTKVVLGKVDRPANLIPLITVRGDCDVDGDIDLADAEDLVSCLGGPEMLPPFEALTGCQCLSTFDFDGDNDVDLADFAAFQTVYQAS